MITLHVNSAEFELIHVALQLYAADKKKDGLLLLEDGHNHPDATYLEQRVDSALTLARRLTGAINAK